jgi:NTP pyrophosphatase (non-canonical NTP hydrolase)
MSASDITTTDSASLAWVTFTESCPPVRYDQFVLQLFKADSAANMKYHAALGIAGEVGELVDVIKREVVYNKSTDGEGKSTRAGIVEELGDIKFFCQAIQNLYGITDTEVFQTNATKLAKRYEDLVYSDVAALHRADKDA